MNHAVEISHIPIDPKIDSKISRKTGKGRRLIILHAITVDWPLVEIDELAGLPIDDLKWRGDTPHPTTREDGKLGAEVLRMAQSHSGDYHDNMNSNMFMQWVTGKLVPTFKLQTTR